MPLRDHFRPPISFRSLWEGLHGGWPMAMVQRLSRALPDLFVAEPRVHLGSCSTGAADLTEQYEYEVQVFDQSHGRRLVAAVELVSPANKDRAESRRAFVTKCAVLLQQNVCVSMVDLVTRRSFNLYADLLSLMGQTDPGFGPSDPCAYAATCRGRRIGPSPRLETWAYSLVVGQPLPRLPLWLSEELAIELDLEISYEETCRVLRIAAAG